MAHERVRVLLVRAQVLPRGLPRHAGHAQREPHPDGVPREHRRDGEGPGRRGGRGRRLRALHAVRCVRAALPEHALHRRLLPAPHAHGRRRQGDARTDGRDGQRARGLEAVERASRRAPQRARAGRRAGQPGARGRLGGRPRHPGGRRDDPLRRLRGRVLPHVLHARVRPAAAEGGRRVRPHARAVVLRRAGRRDGLRRARPQARRPQCRRLARGGSEADHRSRPARLHRLHRGLSELLRRGLRVRDRAGRRAGQRPRQGGPHPAHPARGAHRHLPRPVPPQQAQGRPRGPARAAAGRSRHHVQRRGPRDAVVLLLGRRRRPAGREARDHRGDQPPARGSRAGARGRHADQRLPVVRAAPVAGRGSGRAAARGHGPLRARRPARRGSRSADTRRRRRRRSRP